MSKSTNHGLNGPTTASADGAADDAGSSGDPVAGTSSGATEPLPLDVVFDMLKNERRRNVLKYMREGEGPFTLSDLAEHIAALENDKEVVALNSTERKRVYVGLYQCHLPRMADAGVIEFDRHRGTVRAGENSEQLYPYIDVDDDAERSFRVYAGLAAIFGVGLLAGALVQAALLPVVLPVFLVSIGGYALAERTDLLGF